MLKAETLEKDVDSSAKKDGVTVTGTNRKESWLDNVIDNSCRENSWFGKKCLQIFKVRIKKFWQNIEYKKFLIKQKYENTMQKQLFNVPQQDLSLNMILRLFLSFSD